MVKEIDILLRAADKDCAVVDKTSHVLWTRAELEEASRVGCYPDEDRLAPPGESVRISGPYPGCPQQSGAPAESGKYRLVSQTEHFLIFAPPPLPAFPPLSSDNRGEMSGAAARRESGRPETT
jgi:hypothetical protein